MAKILLKKILKKKRIKVEGIIPCLSFSRATTYRILNGQKKPTLDDLEEFAKQLKVPLEDLYESEYSKDKFGKTWSQY